MFLERVIDSDLAVDFLAPSIEHKDHRIEGCHPPFVCKSFRMRVFTFCLFNHRAARNDRQDESNQQSLCPSLVQRIRETGGLAPCRYNVQAILPMHFVNPRRFVTGGETDCARATIRHTRATLTISTQSLRHN